MQLSGTWYDIAEATRTNTAPFEIFPGILIDPADSEIGVKYNKIALSIVYGFAN